MTILRIPDGQGGYQDVPALRGVSPHIGANGNWWVEDEDTGVPARGPAGDGSGDVLWSELTPALDGKADTGHTHDDRYIRTSGNATKTGDLNMDGGSVRYIRPNTSGGWARGFWWDNLDGSMLAGIGVLGNGADVQYFYLGHGDSPWHDPVFRAYQDRVRITNLEVTGEVTGIEPDDVGAAPASHTHSEYATTEQVNARTPEIRMVSSPELATSPGVLYVVEEG